MTDSSEPTVFIHGRPWKLSDIKDVIEDCRASSWERRVWRRRPALVHRRGGGVSLYRGQKFDPDKIDLVQDGWSHDHCEVCWWELSEDANVLHGVGYTDGQAWICSECYHQFVAAEVFRA